MAAGRLLLPGWMPAVDSNGDPIPNAKVYFYFNKTSTLAPVYSDESLTVRIANPVEANATGRFPAVWADGEVLYSASVEAPYGPAGVPFTYDNLSASLAAEIILTETAETAANDAETAYQNILDAIQAAQDADGAAAVAGAIAGQAAALDVVFAKANTNADNVSGNASSWRSAIGAMPLDGSGSTVSVPSNTPYKASGTGTVTRTIQSRLEDAIYLADYSLTTPNSADFQRAVDDAIALGKNVILTPTMIADGAVTITGRVGIIGVDKKTVVTSTAASFNWITISSPDVSISNLYIDSALRTGGWDFTLDTGASTVLERINITNVTGWNSRGGIRDIGTGNHVTVKLDNFFNRALKGPHVQFTRSFGYLDLINCTADYNGSGADGDFTGFYLSGAGLGAGSGGGKFQSCHVLGTANSSHTNNNGFVLEDYNAAWFLDDNTADTCGASGIIMRRCVKPEGSVTVGLNQDHAIIMEDCQYVSLHVTAQGRNDVSGSLANKDIIRFVNASSGNSNININVGYLSGATGNAVNVIGSQAGPINLVGGVVNNCVGRALVATGSTVVQWTGFVFYDNDAGNYDIAAATQWVEGVFASGGRATFNGPGTA